MCVLAKPLVESHDLELFATDNKYLKYLSYRTRLDSISFSLKIIY